MQYKLGCVGVKRKGKRYLLWVENLIDVSAAGLYKEREIVHIVEVPPSPILLLPAPVEVTK